MASAGHLLLQQKGPVEARIKSLVNNDLKEICRAYNYQVTGNKAALQKRCLEILNTMVTNGDHAGFRDLNHRVSNHGQPPARAPSQTPSTGNTYRQVNGEYSPMPQGQVRPPYGAGRIAGGGRWFKTSPFYDSHETVLPLTDLPDSAAEMPQNRHTVRTNIILTTDVSTRMKADASLRLMLYCGSDPNQYSEIDVAFPNQLEVKINGDDVKANFKGLKNKPGSTKPTDITDKVRKSAGYSNQMCITYALTQKNYGFCVYLVKYNSADVLTERIKAGRHGGGIITKQQVLSEMKQANDDPDIAATSVRMSLKDPISTLRITLPVRSIVCTHNQCFDGAMFLQLQEQAPQWACPVCSKSVSYQSLCVDKYFEEILQQTPTSIEKVDIEPDGEWHVIKDESQPNGHSSRDQRASYDDDFDDDDVVEVPHPIPKSHGISLGKAGTPSHFSPSISSGYAMNTPPLSSRGPSTAPSTSSAHLSNKRPAPGVIDLTFSDDEDEPPRPAKRQSTHASTSTHPGTSTSTPQSYDTPNPPSNPRNPSYATSHGPVTDAYRASVNIARPSSGHSNTQGGSSGIGSRSPWRAEDSSSPSSYQMSNPWTTQSQSLPPVTLGSGQGQAFPPFTIRPPSASSSNVSPTGRQQPIRLPPLQPMNSYSRDPYTGWRSGSQNGYSNSPSGQ